MRGSAGGISNEDGLTLVFNRIENSLEKHRSKFTEQNAPSYDLFKHLIAFQHVIYDKVSNKRAGELRGVQPSSHISDEIFAEVAVSDMLGHNKLYLFSASRALAWGIPHASGSLARTVFESVPKSFYLMARPQDARKFMLTETYPIWKSAHVDPKSTSTKAFLKDPETEETLAGEQITAAMFSKLQKEHSAGRIRKEIYDDNTLKLQNQLYAALSSSSHPTIIRSFMPVSDGRSPVLMRIISDLAFLNLFLTINSQIRLLDARAISESVEFMRAALKDKDLQSRFHNMYPSKDEYRNNLSVAIESLS